MPTTLDEKLDGSAHRTHNHALYIVHGATGDDLSVDAHEDVPLFSR